MLGSNLKTTSRETILMSSGFRTDCYPLHIFNIFVLVMEETFIASSLRLKTQSILMYSIEIFAIN